MLGDYVRGRYKVESVVPIDCIVWSILRNMYCNLCVSEIKERRVAADSKVGGGLISMMHTMVNVDYKIKRDACRVFMNSRAQELNDTDGPMSM